MPSPLFAGYRPDFLAAEKLVPLPQLSMNHRLDIQPIGDDPNGLIHHADFTVLLSFSRRLAWYSAANMDATKTQESVKRTDLTKNWRIEKPKPRPTIISDEWYKPSQKKLERGHLTPADAMEWGDSHEDAILRANDTFHFSNAAPQIAHMNKTEWGMLEAFIGRENAKTSIGRICVQTGPVLQASDPEYSIEVAGQTLKLPVLFWKMVYYLDATQRLCRIGFLMSQRNLLEKSGLLKPKLEDFVLGSDKTVPFADLGDEKTFQVNIKRIETLSGLRFAAADHEPFTDNRPKEMVLKEVEAKDGLESFTLGGRSATPLKTSNKYELGGLVM